LEDKRQCGRVFSQSISSFFRPPVLATQLVFDFCPEFIQTSFIYQPALTELFGRLPECWSADRLLFKTALHTATRLGGLTQALRGMAALVCLAEKNPRR